MHGIVFGIANTAQAGAYLKAAKMMGKSIPTLASPHHSIWPLSMSMKSFAPWEGHYVAAAAASSAERTGEGYEFFFLGSGAMDPTNQQSVV